MTALNATILPAYAVMTQDTSMTRVDGFSNVRDFAEHYGEDTRPDTGPAFRDPECSGCKMTALPEQRLLAGAAGSLLFSMAWRYEVKQAARDIDSLDTFARKRLPELRGLIAQYPRESEIADETIILHIGYSQERGHIIGRLYCAEDGFAGQVIEPGNGHLIQPGELNPSDPEYRELYEAWTPAAQGEGVDRFHELMTAHQYRGAQAGMYRGTPAGISDTVDTGRVTPFTASITHG